MGDGAWQWTPRSLRLEFEEDEGLLDETHRQKGLTASKQQSGDTVGQCCFDIHLCFFEIAGLHERTEGF